ncbi:hypothetical protein Hanom_Chr15g01386851 [Helianthus anomalus]
MVATRVLNYHGGIVEGVWQIMVSDEDGCDMVVQILFRLVYNFVAQLEIMGRRWLSFNSFGLVVIGMKMIGDSLRWQKEVI